MCNLVSFPLSDSLLLYYLQSPYSWEANRKKWRKARSLQESPRSEEGVETPADFSLISPGNCRWCLCELSSWHCWAPDHIVQLLCEPLPLWLVVTLYVGVARFHLLIFVQSLFENAKWNIIFYLARVSCGIFDGPCSVSDGWKENGFCSSEED